MFLSPATQSAYTLPNIMSINVTNEVIYTEDRFPVSVLMERLERKRDRWSFTDWKLTGIFPGDQVTAGVAAKTLVYEDEARRQYLWSQFDIELIRDGAESYWNNLMASKPALFVVCREEEESEDLVPFLVTANYDDIIGYQEVDDQVFSLPIPPEIYRWLERYVVNNYVPPQRRKRKRVKWSDENEKAPPPARRH